MKTLKTATIAALLLNILLFYYLEKSKKEQEQAAAQKEADLKALAQNPYQNQSMLPTEIDKINRDVMQKAYGDSYRPQNYKDWEQTKNESLDNNWKSGKKWD